MTNEQSVVVAEEKLHQLKKEYVFFLTTIVRNQKISLDEFLKCQQLGTEYFNYLETFVGNSGLLGAHKNGKWVTGLAENCHSVLDAYIDHITFLRKHKSQKSMLEDINIEPDTLAFSNMQRMVKEYLEEYSDSLKNKYIKNKLPTNGFTVPAHKDEKPEFSQATNILINNNGKVEVSGDKNININGVNQINGNITAADEIKNSCNTQAKSEKSENDDKETKILKFIKENKLFSIVIFLLILGCGYYAVEKKLITPETIKHYLNKSDDKVVSPKISK